MNDTLIKGICEELEFNTEIGDYKVSSSAFDEGRMNITITDCQDEFNSITADVRLGKLKDFDSVCISVVYKKRIWNKTYESFGKIIDNTESAIKFLKECAISIIRTL